MKENLLFTGIYILVLFMSSYFQYQISSKNIKKGIIIPFLLIVFTVVIWCVNSFDVMKCLPITIILGFICIINILIWIFLYHKMSKVNN